MEDISPELRRRLEENRRKNDADFWWKFVLVAFVVFAIIGWLVE